MGTIILASGRVIAAYGSRFAIYEGMAAYEDFCHWGDESGIIRILSEIGV